MNAFSKEDFENLFEIHFEDLMSFVYSYVRDTEVSKDIVHDSFFTLWKNRQIIDTSLYPKSYLYKLARNYALNHLRHQRVIHINEKPFINYTHNIQQDLDDYSKKLDRMIQYVDNLSEKQKEVLKKCFVEGKMYKEIAEELDISVNTVKTHLKRAIQYLREEFKDDIILLFFLRKK